MSYPGACPTRYANPVTFWELKKNVQFGGVNGNPIKTMDAMVSYHGFVSGKNSGHMEIFWFTRQYGRTMWQAWIPASLNPTKTTNCIVPDTINFQGIDFVVADCRDWSNVKPATTALIPEWPLPPANLLQHSHFDDGGGYSADDQPGLWHRGGKSAEGNIINWGLKNSTSERDTKYGKVGVRYLAINCGGTCAGTREEIFQEVPIDQIAADGTYLYGIDARSEGGKGILQVTLQELDENNRVLWQESVQGTVSPDNREGRTDAVDSVYLTSAFIHKVTAIPVQPGAVKIRFIITPLSPQTFDIIDSWLNRFPAMSGPLGGVQ